MNEIADSRGKAPSTSWLASLALFVISLLICLGTIEVALRIKNSSMRNYDIEMWRYSRELKVRSDNPVLGHVHLKGRSAVLQSVVIRTNHWGLRGGPIATKPNGRRIMFLGSSITLGWGVPEEETISARAGKLLEAQGEKVEVLNAGIGNYNTERYVEHYLTELKELAPTDIVVHYFLRDAESLDAGRDNFLLRNSELAATTFMAAAAVINRIGGGEGERSLVDHYRAVYAESAPGYIKMRQSLQRLAEYARRQNIRLYLAMTPDVHNLKDYKFGFIHERMKGIAAELGYTFVDLLPAFGGRGPDEIWAMPGDPHPNALGHKLMAETLAPALVQPR